MVIIVSPLHDYLTHVCSKWAKYLGQTLDSLGFSCTVISGNSLNRNNLEHELRSKLGLGTFVFLGHGSDDGWRLVQERGDQIETLIDVDNCHLLSGLIVYTIACYSAGVLGPKTVRQHGARCYFGYREDLFIPYECNVSKLEELGKCVNAGLLALLNGDEYKDAEKVQRDQYYALRLDTLCKMSEAHDRNDQKDKRFLFALVLSCNRNARSFFACYP